jgi:hypothetical protein
MLIRDSARLETIAQIAVADRPSGLAISDDGRTLLGSHLLVNTISVLTLHCQ